MEDYYIRLFYLELKEEYQEKLPNGWSTEIFYAGFSTNYRGEFFEPQLSARFTSAAFFFHFEEADYVNIHLDRKFNVLEYTIDRNVIMRAPISEEKESSMHKFKVATQWKKQARRNRKYRPLIRVKQRFIIFAMDIFDRTFNRGPLRIVERTQVDGKVVYVIQRKNLLWWSDCQAYSTAQYDTLEEAQQNLCYFDGSEPVDVVVDKNIKSNHGAQKDI